MSDARGRQSDRGDPVVSGRVLWRDGERLGLRTAARDLVVEPAGDAGPGDLVVIPAEGAVPEVVRRFGAAADAGAVDRGGSAGDEERAYPDAGTEVARMPRARLEALAARARAQAAVREMFAARGFIEVEAPLLVPSPGLEIHLDAVPAGQGGWLITSPEYQMKRLLAAGLERIYTLCRAFRAGEVGQPAPARVHHAGVVPRVRRARGGHARHRGAGGGRGRGGPRCAAVAGGERPRARPARSTRRRRGRG